jgi:hypothetical protein
VIRALNTWLGGLFKKAEEACSYPVNIGEKVLLPPDAEPIEAVVIKELPDFVVCKTVGTYEYIPKELWKKGRWKHRVSRRIDDAEPEI